jgi:pyroglutamyl-peptidase
MKPDKAALPTVLVTGFEPFGGDAVNPSALVAHALHGKRIGGHRVVAVELPCVFDQSIAVLKAAIKTHSPALVLCLGQAGGRAALSFERIAVNINDARIADNAGAQPIDTRVIDSPRAPAAYFSTLPIKAMQHAVARAGIAAEVSQTAGTFVCNHVFYGLMHALKARRSAGASGSRPAPRGGFVHVPYLPEQTNSAPSMRLADMTQGIAIALEAALKRTAAPAGKDVDDKRGAGALH